MTANAGQIEKATASPLPKREWVSFLVGMLLILAVNVGPVHVMAERSFSGHMIQHMVLVVVAAPLLAVAWPLLEEVVEEATRALPGEKSGKAVMAMLRASTHPIPALVGSTAALWLWHIPAIYDAAVRSDFVHSIEHLVFVVAFIPFWRPLMPDRSGNVALRSNGSRILYLSFGMLTHGILGSWLNLHDKAIYAAYLDQSTGARTPLQDQQLGGAIMWIVGTLAMIIAAIVTMKDEA